MSQRGSCPKGAQKSSPTRRWIQTHSTIALVVALILGTTITLIAQNTPSPTPTPKTVTLRADGVERQVSTTKPTVQTLLHQEHIALNDHDLCDPQINTTLSNGMVITVSRVTYHVVRERISIPAPEVVRVSDKIGNSPVVYKGRPGVAVQTRCMWKKDGVVTVQWISSTRTVVRPMPTIIIRPGTPSRSGLYSRNTFFVVATAYTPYDAGCNGWTANGMRAGRGVIAVDPRVIPLGTRVFVEGYGLAIAADTGGAIKGRRIDVCFPSKREAFQWGRRTVQITIL